MYDVEVFLIRYRMSCSSISVFHCFFAWSAVARARLGTHIAEYTIGLPVWPTPGPPHATTPSSSLEMTDRSAPSTGRGRRSGCRSRRRGHQWNAGARDSWRQELTGAKFAVAGAVAAAAGAGINGTQERVILGDKN